MNILWFSWKDSHNPLAGGAELISGSLMKNLVQDGHNVRLITAGFKNCPSHENINGVEIYRVGSRHSVYIKAFLLYRNEMRTWPDVVIDEMNTIPFGCAFYTRCRTILLTYQLARRVWFYQMIFPFSLLGYIIEPVYLFMLSKLYKQVITESESTRNDLARFGFSKATISVIRVGIALDPLPELRPKDNLNIILSLGALRPMKKTLDIVKGFEQAKELNPHLLLKVAGDTSDPYANRVVKHIQSSRHKDSIELLGKVTPGERIRLMREAAVIIVTSTKEGWGLIVTEANSQGTPAIAYDTDGLRDSIRNGETGVLVPQGDIKALGSAINNLVRDQKTYSALRANAWEWSRKFTFENSYKDFLRVININ